VLVKVRQNRYTKTGLQHRFKSRTWIYHLWHGLIYRNDLQILNLAYNKTEIERRVHAVIDKFAERGLRSLAVAYQVGELRRIVIHSALKACRI